MAPQELQVIRLLIEHPEGLTPPELMDRARRPLSSASIYVGLKRMFLKGWVMRLKEKPIQIRYFITKHGRNTYFEFLNENWLATADYKDITK